MVTEGQPATGDEPEGAPPTPAPAPPTPAPTPTPFPDERYKGLQRRVSSLEEENRGLQERLDSAPPATGGMTPDMVAQNAYLYYLNAAKAQGMEEQAAGQLAQGYAQAAKAAALYQQSQQQLANVQTRLQVEQIERQARESAQRTTQQMRSFADTVGLKADDPNLDYGDEGGDPAERWEALRTSIPRAQEASKLAVKGAPAEPVPAPDRSAERVDTTGGARPAQDNAEILKRQALEADAEYRQGRGRWNPFRIKELFDKARQAGAQF